jgi:DNA-binding response OmpR family regulator
VSEDQAAQGVDDSDVDEFVDESQEHDPEEAAEPTLSVLIYSDDRTTRQQVQMALGRRPARDLPALVYTEVATLPALEQLVSANKYDVIILDGEAVPAGGMGIARQLKDELFNCPPILLLIARPQDAWLATWSRADAVAAHPIEAMALARAMDSLIRPRVPITA